jgi:hypothetical protein
LRALARVLKPYLAELDRGEPDGLIDVESFFPAATRGERRTIMAACREGRIAEAVKIARRWRAPRASIVAWAHTLGPRIVRIADTSPTAPDDLEELRVALTRPARVRRCP